jgi:phage-related holin
MHDFKTYLHLFDKIGCALKYIFTTISGWVTMFFIIILPGLSTAQQTLLLLAILFVFDFITGVIASWIEYKKGLSEPATISSHFFTSEKMRTSGVKFITYGLGIITAYILESIFLIKEFEPSHLTTQKLTLTTIVTLFFCIVESYSIFFENIKRMGFDLLQKTRSIIREGWRIYKEIKGEELK